MNLAGIEKEGKPDHKFQYNGKEKQEEKGQQKEVKSFVLKLSEYARKEIKGYSYSSDGSGNITDIALGMYKINEYTESSANLSELIKKHGGNYSRNNILEAFHTHPEGKLGTTASAPHLSKDVTELQEDKPTIPNARFIILYRVNGVLDDYDYTHEYKPRKR